MIARIYTDGASWSSGEGGWSALMFVDGKFEAGRYGGKLETTNNQMELKGVISGMEMLPTVEMERCRGCGVVVIGHTQGELCEVVGTIRRPIIDNAVIVSDSQYCVKGATTWVHGWKRNGWKTADKKPVKNQELWEQVDALAKVCGARFEWVKGHSTDIGNVLADEFAVAGKKYVHKHKYPEWDMRITQEQVAKMLDKIA